MIIKAWWSVLALFAMQDKTAIHLGLKGFKLACLFVTGEDADGCCG